MTKTSNIRQGFAPAVCVLGLLTQSVLAQKIPVTPTLPARTSEIKIKITETIGNNEVIELNDTYRIDNLTDEKRDALVNKLVDSLRAKRNGKTARQMTIVVEDARDTSRVGQNLRRHSLNRSDWEQGLAMQFDTLGRQLRRFEFQFPSDFGAKLAQPFEAWARDANTKPASIRSLSVYPNNPDHNQLNVRFTAPATGDVLIVITNSKGKEVARKELSNFTGEFMGQLDLGKKTTGTFFVTVTQNDDGAVKRVVID